ncbi:MAG: ABC transporter ATP-binding protein [Caldilineaceae bacterium]|nr:ABC transporter ATP-binding protein [Caldilineaceae bacterium]
MIRTEKLSKEYNGFAAVQDVSLQVRPNEIYGFLGPNGAGKTTTILMLLGIVKPTHGRVLLFDQPLAEDYFGIKRRIGVVAEHQFFYDEMTARDYLRFFAELYDVANAANRIETLLETVDLRAFGNARARDFSRGMQQKLGLARALLHDPELLILDEPVSALDPHGVLDIRHLLLEQARAGKTIFISSHILSEVEQTADRVGIMHRGRLVAEDSLANLRRRLHPQLDLEVELDHAHPQLAEQLAQLPFVDEALSQGHKLLLKVDGHSDHRRAISQAITSAGALILEMRSKEMSLEEAFVTITEQNVSLLTDGATGEE